VTNEEIRLSSDHNEDSQKSPVFLVNMFHELFKYNSTSERE